MKRLIILLCFSVCLFLNNLLAQKKVKDVQEFRGLKYGVTYQEAKKYFEPTQPLPCLQNEIGFSCLKYEEQLFDKPAEIYLFFVNNKFTKSTVSIGNIKMVDTLVFHLVRFSLEKKYGKPSSFKEAMWIIEYKFPSSIIALYYDREAKRVVTTYESILYSKLKKDDSEKF